jgi:hypothetical protein
MAINNHSVITRKSDVPTVDLDGELAMMDTDKGKYYGMNLVASRIWAMIKEPKRLNEIIETLVHEYDISSSQCKEDVLYFLDILKKEGLIDVK